MKDSKYKDCTTNCWSHRHELLGLIFLIIATLLTIVSHSGCGIVAMFIVGLVLCCCKHWHPMCYSHEHCHCPCHEGHEHEMEKPAGKAKK